MLLAAHPAPATVHARLVRSSNAAVRPAHPSPAARPSPSSAPTPATACGRQRRRACLRTPSPAACSSPRPPPPARPCPRQPPTSLRRRPPPPRPPGCRPKCLSCCLRRPGLRRQGRLSRRQRPQAPRATCCSASTRARLPPAAAMPCSRPRPSGGGAPLAARPGACRSAPACCTRYTATPSCPACPGMAGCSRPCAHPQEHHRRHNHSLSPRSHRPCRCHRATPT